MNFFEILKFFDFLNFYYRLKMQFLDFNFATRFISEKLQVSTE